jgi:raffinose/stachyose/melibiose transport system substrate-binding protein
MSVWPSKSKSALAIGIALASVVALAGCSSASTTKSASGITGKSMTFVTDQGGPAGAKYVQLIKEFEAANPGYKVNMQILPGDATYNSVITSRIESGKSPDLIEIINAPAGATPFTNAHLLSDLGDQPWVKQLLPVVAGNTKNFGGKTYGFVTQIDASGFFYNKTLFKKYNVSIPTTWSELLADVKTFRDAGVTPMGIGGKDGWPVALQAYSMAAQVPAFAPGNTNGPALAAGKVKFSSSAAWKQVINGFSTLVTDKAFDPSASGITWPTSAVDFSNGKDAMFYQGDFAIPAIRAAKPGFDVGMFTLPFDGNPAATTITYGSELSIPTKAPNAGLAKKFLDFLAQKGNYAKYLTSAAAFSSLQGVSGKLDPALAQIAPFVAKKAYEAAAPSGLNPATLAALQSGVVSILAGSGSTRATLAGMDQAQTTK